MTHDFHFFHETEAARNINFASVDSSMTEQGVRLWLGKFFDVGQKFTVNTHPYASKIMENTFFPVEQVGVYCIAMIAQVEEPACLKITISGSNINGCTF